MRNLRALDLAHNFLQGGIPSNLGMLTQLKSLALQHNAFKGALPVELGNLKNLGECCYCSGFSYYAITILTLLLFVCVSTRE